MVLWIGFALLAAAVVWAVTRPLLASGAATPGATDSEIAVYRDQLAEIEAERAQGLLAPAEAEGARVELARRVIRRAEETKGAGAASHSSFAQQAVIYAAAAIPVIGIGIYLAVGSPQEVIEKILYQHEALGHQRYLMQMSVGTMPHAQTMRSIELFGTKVAPAIRKALKAA